jgi:hypothetical protein
MREGKFELIVASVNDSFAGLRVINERCIGDHVYAVAVPGLEYCVKVNIYRDKNGLFTPPRLRIGLYVDGNDVQYWKRIDLTKVSLLPTAADEPVSATFWGFKKNVADIRSFQFAATKTTSTAESSSSLQPDTKSVGQIRAVIYEAMVIGGTFENKNGIHEVPESLNIPEDVKFWQQASLTTNAGRKIPDKVEQFDPLEKWINVGPLSDPLQEMTLFYHTEATLDCILNMTNPNDCRTTSILMKRSASVALTHDVERESVKKRNCTAAEAWDLTGDNDDDSIKYDPDDTHGAEEALYTSDAVPVTVETETVPKTEIDGEEAPEPPLKYEDDEQEILYIARAPKEIVVIDISEEGV